MKDMSNEDDFTADEKRPLIPAGTYEVCCIGIDKSASHFKSLKMFLKFRIITPGHHLGTELFMAMNLIDTKTGKPFKKVPLGTKYYEQWVIANRNVLPKRNDKMPSSIFKEGVFEAVVRTVKPKFGDGTEKPACFHYSIVDSLKRRTA